MSLISEVLLCTECGELFGELIERSQRDEAHECRTCGEVQAYRTMTVPHVSTSKTSESIPDAVGKRFDKLRIKQALKKELASATARIDRVSEKKIKKELTQLQK